LNSSAELGGARLGTAVNLLFGLRPVWNAADPADSPFFHPPGAPLTTSAPCVEPSLAPHWSWPEITLHDDVESLVSELLDVRVVPIAREGGPFAMPSGVLALRGPRRADAIRSIGDRFGVNVHDACGYLLIAVRHEAGRAEHEVTAQDNHVLFQRSRHLTPAGERAMARLRPGRRREFGGQHDAAISAREAQRGLDFCYEYGTHFLAAVRAGDRLVQIFSYDGAAYAQVLAAFVAHGDERLRGVDALAFASHIRPKAGASAGRIVSLANGSALERSRVDGVWRDEAIGESLLAPFGHGDAACRQLLSSFARITAVGYDLVPLDRFMEHFRSAAFRRVVRGALFAAYGRAISLPVPRLIDLTPMDGPRVDLAAIAHGDAHPTRMTAAAPVLHIPPDADIALDANIVTIAADRIDAPRNTGAAATLRLAPHARLVMAAREMEGAVLIVRDDGQEALLDGLRFACEGDDDAPGRMRVVLRGDLATVPSEDAAALAMPLAQALASVLAHGATSANDRGRALAIAQLDMLACAIPASSADDVLDRLRACSRTSAVLLAAADDAQDVGALARYADVRADVLAILSRGELLARESAETDARAKETFGADVAALWRAHAASLAHVRATTGPCHQRILDRSLHDAEHNVRVGEPSPDDPRLAALLDQFEAIADDAGAMRAAAAELDRLGNARDGWRPGSSTRLRRARIRVRRAAAHALDAFVADDSPEESARLERVRVAAMLASVVMLQATALGPFAFAAEMRPRAPTVAALSWIGIRQDALLMADARDEPLDGRQG
jgi:hypothetical protein